MIFAHWYNNKLEDSSEDPRDWGSAISGGAGDLVHLSVYSYWPTVYFASVLVANLWKYETYTVVAYIQMIFVVCFL